MSVLVKGMEMPKRCEECPMCIAIGLKSPPLCALTGSRILGFANARLDSCPLIEVPPHGDLIDRSQISGLFDRDRHNRNIYQLVWNDAINTVIQTMPTIIPAEEGEA